ncbi:hypothetical protein CARUB_v10021833mg [Capsella rubella]|uniref:Sieve element occlusion N-terminal domain-containing protein n=1 Tax=Capsella rubella TaxID=81985 RepID=R0I880_9BRAS|nr:hypothetical protein CARUB_v10021833mg [Capsella rubella]
MNFRSDISALNEDIIVEQLLRSHDPDGRWLDSEMLLQEVETILSFVLQNDVSRPLMTENCITNVQVFDSKETLPYAISRISVQMLCPCIGQNEIQTRTMVLFDLLKEYRWDAKAVLVLGVLAAAYGGLLLPVHLASCEPVASSIATLNQLPNERTKLRPWLESLTLLVRAMLDVTKCLIKFERLPIKQVQLDNNIVDKTLFNVYLATYRVVKSVLACLQQIPYFKQTQQIAITELKEKVILLLLSKPPVEPLFFLLQQLYDHPSSTNTEQNYEIIWIPIPSSQKWTDEEKEIFDYYSNSLPWISVRQPWLMSSTIVNFFIREWQYGDDEAMVVVMDSNGEFVNMNAMDMVLIWGVKAYPFSVTREDELWEEHGWSTQLLLDGIHPAYETWVKQGSEICIFGSENLDWVDEFVSLARKIQNLGFQLELVYLSNERTKAMEESSILFSPTVQQLFWLRLESIERSKLKRTEPSKPDRVFEEVTKLLDFDYGKHKGWGIIGKGSEAVTVDGEKLAERMSTVVRWGEYAKGLGFTEAIEIAAEKPCELTHTVVVPFDEALTMKVVTCEKCKRPMKKFVAYQ